MAMSRSNQKFGEIQLRVYQFKLFEKEIPLLIKDSNYEIFLSLIDDLNLNFTFEAAKERLVNKYIIQYKIEKRQIFTNDFIISKFINENESLLKIEEMYNIHVRDTKINNILKD